jgi:hypothetical protein
MSTSAQIRSQLIQALSLDLVGPTPDILAQLELEGRTEEAAELREELLDRPPQPLVSERFPDRDTFGGAWARRPQQDWERSSCRWEPQSAQYRPRQQPQKEVGWEWG